MGQTDFGNVGLQLSKDVQEDLLALFAGSAQGLLKELPI